MMTEREEPTGLPDPDHRRPEGLDDITVDALGRLSKALETIHRVRGHLYSFHQLTGTPTSSWTTPYGCCARPGTTSGPTGSNAS